MKFYLSLGFVCERFQAQNRLIPPRFPHFNGKVERRYQTDEEEFYRLCPYAARKDLQRPFARWLWHYNHIRLHMGLNGKNSIQRAEQKRSGGGRKE